VKFHLEQQIKIHTSHKPQRAPQNQIERWNESKRWWIYWNTCSTFTRSLPLVLQEKWKVV